MIDIYAIYTNTSNGINTGSTKIQAIPAASESAINILDPTVKGEMGNAESMDFSVQPGTPYYDAFIQMRTYIRVDYGTGNDKVTIFYGRVLTISDGYFGERKIHCEGALAFLNDSFYPGTKESERVKTTIKQHITKVLNNHNAQLNDPNRQILLGEVPGNYSNNIASAQRIADATRAFGNSSWTSSKSLLEDLKSHYGGMFRIRYEGGHCYLDWLNHFFRRTLNAQEVRVGKNLLDLSNSSAVSNIFTAIIPIGKTTSGDNPIYITGYRTDIHTGNYLTVPQITQLYSSAQLDSGYHNAEDYAAAIDNYGLIFKPVNFDEAHTQQKLLELAAEWIKDNYQGGVTSFSVKAVDMYLLGEDTDKLLLGDRVKLIFPVGEASNDDSFSTYTTSIIRTCTGFTFPLYNPENSQFTFGIPANALSKTYGENSKKQKKASSYSGSTPIKDPEPEDDQDSWTNKVFSWLLGHQVWYASTGNVESGPRDPSQDEQWKYEDNTFYHPTGSDTNGDGTGEEIYEIWSPAINGFDTDQDGTKHPRWVYNGDNCPTGTFLRKIKSEVHNNISLVSSLYLYDYIKHEYNIDLRQDLSVKMPSVLKNEDGNLSIFTGDGTTKLADYLKDQKILNMFNQDGKLIGRILGENGDYLFAELEQNPDGTTSIKLDDQGNPILISMRNLKLSVVNNERKMGYIVTEEQDGTLGLNLGNSKLVGELSLGIEDYNQGKLVVARTVGDLVYLGTQEIDGQQVVAQNLTAASLNHMDLVCGDIEYRENPVTGVRETYIKSAGGVRVSRGTIDPNTGDYVVDEHGDMVMSEFGIYDDNNLTGGIMIQKINDDDETQLKIEASKIDIEGIEVHVSAQDLADFGVWTDSNRNQKIGLVVQKINSGDVATMLSGSAIYIGGDPSNDLNTKVSSIDQELINKGISITNIDTRVTTIGGGLTNAQAAIAQNNQSITAINTDIVSITGRLDAAEATIRNINANYITSDYLVGKHTIAAGSLSAQHFYIDTGIDSETGSYDLRHAVAHANITQNANTGEYTLHLYSTTGGEISPLPGHSLTFRKAASGPNNVYLDGSWSGGKLTVVAKSIDNGSVVTSISAFDRTLIDDQAAQNSDGTTYTSGSDFYIPIRARYGTTPYAYQNTGFRAHGQLDEVSIGSNGPYTYTSSNGKIGMYKVNVTVPPDTPVTKKITVSGNVYTPGNVQVASKVTGGTVGTYKTLSFASGTYTIPNSSNNHCVVVKDGSNIVGMYSVETMYQAGVTQGESNITSNGLAAHTYYPTGSTQSGVIPAGTYVSGAQSIGAVVCSASLKPENVKAGVTINIGNSSNSTAVKTFSGSFTSTFSSGQTGATSAQILSGYSAYVNGNEVKGSISNLAGGTHYAESQTKTIIPAGVIVGGDQYLLGVVTINLTPANVRYGKTVLVGDSVNTSRIATVEGTFTSTFSSGQTGAAAAQILKGYSAYVNGSEVKGSVTVKAATRYKTRLENVTVPGPVAYPEGLTLLATLTRNITEENIKYGVRVRVGDEDSSVRIADVTGKFTSVVSSGQTKAAAAQIRSGYSAFVDGAEVKGSMTSQAGKTWYATTSTQTIISSGKYISGTQYLGAVTTSNLIAANIKSGVTIKVGDSTNSGRIANVTGTYTGSSSTPSASNILIGNTQFNTGLPGGVSTYSSLDSITTLLRNSSNKRGYIYFKTTISGGTGEKWYRFATPD